MTIETHVARQLDSALQALEILRGTLLDLRTELAVAQRVAAEPVRVERLRRAVEDVGVDRPAKPLFCPDEIVRQWRNFVAGRGPALSARSLRYLCWAPDVANTREFRQHLMDARFDLRARAIQGLIRSCHMRWDADRCTLAGAVTFARECLRGYRGPNRVLKRWKDAEDVLFDHAQFARDLLSAERTPHDQSTHWNVDEQSPFFVLAMTAAAEALRSKRRRASAAAVRDILFWNGWPLRSFKEQIGQTLLLPEIEDRVPAEELKALILSDGRLGDPRLPANQTNWVGVPSEARDRFIQWLSAADIKFFFDHVMRRGQDPHGRKPFWLQYLHRVKRSRTLLSAFHVGRLKQSADKALIQRGSFGRTYADNISAFLLDFGNLLVVEFSEPGNACYCYGPTLARYVVPDFWSQEPFPIWDKGRTDGQVTPSLKQRDVLERLTTHTIGDDQLTRGFRFSHTAAWQEIVRQQLAMFGIRPK